MSGYTPQVRNTAADLLYAIDALHQSVGFGACSCGIRDCLTARLLHPEADRADNRSALIDAHHVLTSEDK
jgi:hypothetical protein